MLKDIFGGGGQFFKSKPRQEHEAEREASCKMTKLRVDWGHVIDVGEGAVVTEKGGQQHRRVAKRAGMSSSWDKLYF